MKTVKNTFIYLFATAIEKGIAFLLIPLFAHNLSTQDYGILTLIQAFIAVLVILFSLSLFGAATRYHFDGKRRYRRFHYGNILALITLITLLWTIALYPLKEEIFTLLGGIPSTFFSLALLIAYFSAIFQLYQLRLQMEYRAILYSLNSIIKTVLFLIFSTICVFYVQCGAQGVLEAQLFALVIILFLVFYKDKKEFFWNFNIKLAKRNLSYSIFLVPHNLLGIALKLMDRFFIGYMMSIAQAGVYALGAQIAGILGIFNVIANRAFTPVKFATLKEKNYAYLRNIGAIYITITSVMAVFISLFSKDLVTLLAPKTYEDAVGVVVLLSFYFVFQMYYFMVSSVMFYVEEATRVMPLLTLFSLICNAILNYFLIHIFGLYGAAFASLLSMMIMVYIVIFIARYYIDIAFNHFKLHIVIFLAAFWGGSVFFTNFNIVAKILLFLSFVGIAVMFERTNPLAQELLKKIKI